MKTKRNSAVRYVENGIVNILSKTSGNEKTGMGFITSHFNSEISPIDSRKQGIDSETVCKGCVYANGNGCYTNPLFLNSIWKMHTQERYFLAQNASDFTILASKIVKNEYLRFGNFGNPSLLPLETVETLYNSAAISTGYMADWQTQNIEYRKYFMASVQSLQALENASDLGYRSFVSIPENNVESFQEKAKNKGISTVICINTRNPMINCKQCGLCDGIAKGRKSNIINPIHGYQTKKAIQAVNSFNV